MCDKWAIEEATTNAAAADERLELDKERKRNGKWLKVWEQKTQQA